MEDNKQRSVLPSSVLDFVSFISVNSRLKSSRRREAPKLYCGTYKWSLVTSTATGEQGFLTGGQECRAGLGGGVGIRPELKRNTAGKTLFLCSDRKGLAIVSVNGKRAAVGVGE